MSIRLALAITAGAIFVFALDLGLSVHHLNVATAATSHVVQIHRDYAGAMDASGACPAAASAWCQSAGGLAE